MVANYVSYINCWLWISEKLDWKINVLGSSYLQNDGDEVLVQYIQIQILYIPSCIKRVKGGQKKAEVHEP